MQSTLPPVQYSSIGGVQPMLCELNATKQNSVWCPRAQTFDCLRGSTYCSGANGWDCSSKVKGRFVSCSALLSPFLYLSCCPSLSILFTLLSTSLLPLLSLPSLWPHLSSLVSKQQPVSFPKVNNQNQFYLALSFLFLSLLTHPHPQQGQRATSCPEPWSVQGWLGLRQGWERSESKGLECVFF